MWRFSFCRRKQLKSPFFPTKFPLFSNFHIFLSSKIQDVPSCYQYGKTLHKWLPLSFKICTQISVLLKLSATCTICNLSALIVNTFSKHSLIQVQILMVKIHAKGKVQLAPSYSKQFLKGWIDFSKTLFMETKSINKKESTISVFLGIVHKFCFQY